MIKPVYLSGAARTAIGTFGGSLSHVPAAGLAAAAVKGAIAKAGISADTIDEVIFGNVIGAGLGQNVARQVSIGAGLSASIGATTVNKVCGSGLKAVMLAAQGIQCGDASVVIAGGTESMSRAPYLLDKARNGYRLGNGVLIDSIIRDGLWDVYNNVHMGTCGDACASKYNFTREQQDDFAVASFKRAQAAKKSGEFAGEIVAVEGVLEDENPKKFNEEKLRKLKPAFGKDGTITAGNASSINDGAAAVVVSGDDRSAKPQAKILGFATFAQAPEWFTTAPIGAIDKLLKQLSLKVSDVDLFEINEAFSVVVMAAMKDLAIPHEKVNVNGGAVALGHPIGASGTRTLVTLIHAMKKRNAKIGVVSLCLGGGEAVAMAIEAVG
ncbi:MAG TPA: thiolase family protein [Tepidisphaeraceae bacterium]|jgi:acetyl-CoA C-acetyltransferase|nr:thiolase family protein [Tepidisphaeraceae bacterium]